MATVMGQNLVVKFGAAGTETLVACSTSCTLNINQEFTDVTCKDTDSVSKVAGVKSWDISVDALYQDTDADGTGGFVDLSTLILTGPNDCHVIFEDKTHPGAGATPTPRMWSGKAVLTSCSLTGDDKAPATYTASFVGNGPLTFAEASV